MKPDWKDAPSWAKWLAQDESGDWAWFELKPEIGFQVWIWQDYSEWEFATHNSEDNINIILDWQSTLEKRPKAGTK